MIQPLIFGARAGPISGKIGEIIKGYWVILGTEVTDPVAQAELGADCGKIPRTPQPNDSSAIAEGSTQYGASHRCRVSNI